MNFLEKELKKGIFQEVEKAWDQNKTKFGMKTGQQPTQQAPPATGAPPSASYPHQPAPQPLSTAPNPPAAYAPQQAYPGTAPAQTYATSAPISPPTDSAAPAQVYPAGMGQPVAAQQPQMAAAGAGGAGPVDSGAGASAEAPKKMGFKDKILAKVGEKANDPAFQEKAEKMIKTKAKRALFKF